MPVKITIEEAREVAKRFTEVFNLLRYLKMVKTKKEFCEAIGLGNASNLNRMNTNDSTSQPSITNILLLHKKYNVSVEWIMLGKGPILS